MVHYCSVNNSCSLEKMKQIAGIPHGEVRVKPIIILVAGYFMFH